MNAKDAQRFHNAYITANKSELDKLWKENSPKSFIKFYSGKYEQSGTNYFLNHLEKQNIWLSLPTEFNDPFDCVLNIDFTNDIKRIQKELLIEELGETEANVVLNSPYWKNNMAFLSDFLNTYAQNPHYLGVKSEYVGCFSEPENLYSKIMWSHYANSHYGVCAEYDFDSVNNISPFGCIPVKYTDNYEVCFDTQSTNEKVQNFLRLVYCKAEEWQYEREWRVAIQENYSGNKGLSVPFAMPKKIYLGCRIGHKLKSDIMNLCKGTDIDIFQMKLKPGTFCLEACSCEKI